MDISLPILLTVWVFDKRMIAVSSVKQLLDDAVIPLLAVGVTGPAAHQQPNDDKFAFLGNCQAKRSTGDSNAICGVGCRQH